MNTMNLGGAWEFRQRDTGSWMPAQVPGSVLADLLRNGQIEDPFWRENEYQIREITQADFEYRRSFVLDEEFLKEERVELCFDGLDTLAEVSVNGSRVLSANNMHRRWVVKVKEFLHPGENQLVILFSSPNRYIQSKFEEGDVSYVATGCMKGNNYLRKAHCMFGWDWGPQLPDAGIWRDVWLRACSGAWLEEVYPVQRHEDGKVTLTLHTRLSHQCAGRDLQLTARLTGPDGEVLETTAAASGDENQLTLVVENPRLWWPNGYGEHPLYQLEVSLSEDGTHRNDVQMRLGLRTLTVSTQKDQWGQEFAVMVNGVKIFSMGADYIPEDSLFTRMNPDRTRRLVEDCVKANFNSIRVWGGGCYPADWFFDLCDEYGLLVWQDFMFACNVYVFDEDFEENITAEVIDNIRRIRHHASLALWCGNNEMETAWNEWADVKCHTPALRADYLHQFEFVMKKLAAKYDPETFYWPSSPSSGGSFDRPNDPNCGDVHYWDVWHELKPFTDYRNYLFRYCSEFGFQSFPCLKTVESFTLPEDRNIFSPVMESHQKNGSANGKILFYLSDNYRYPADFDSLLYVSQLLQAQAIQYGVEHWRRNRGRCMGAIYWQLNDCWPVASWASIDYFGRWKALHYAAKRFFAPLTASILDEGIVMSVWMENEYREAQDWKLRVCLKDMKNQTLFEKVLSGRIGALCSEEVFRQDFAELTAGRERGVYLEYQLLEGETLVRNEVCFFVRPKYLELLPAAIEVEVAEQADHFVLTLSCDVFAAMVELQLEGADAVFSDNYFSLTGTRQIFLSKSDLSVPMTGEQLKDALRVRSLRDSY